MVVRNLRYRVPAGKEFMYAQFIALW